MLNCNAEGHLNSRFYRAAGYLISLIQATDPGFLCDGVKYEIFEIELASGSFVLVCDGRWGEIFL